MAILPEHSSGHSIRRNVRCRSWFDSLVPGNGIVQSISPPDGHHDRRHC